VAPPVVPPMATGSVSVSAVAITGLIVNGVNSRPLVGVIIDLDGRPRAESGPNGRFRIDDVPVGMHLLSTRAVKFRARIQPVSIIVPNDDPDIGPRNDFIVLLFAPSAYFDGFPRLGDTPPCRTHRDCPSQQVCMMNNFREMDASACTVPKPCATEADCKLGQQCEPVELPSGDEMRACHGQPAPEVGP
jgi:hypothetical protein